ncbi:hypothetical protein EYF80_020852 [Liparis tanakae]|uniref:Uncharacterized protein n=1 Tax=Liparis tanakae TaxID=230148 RepID=A0A4Z2HTW0_9TELE|nr:hypothetical protein EYF80_020852 [Liparis tanakae]
MSSPVSTHIQLLLQALDLTVQRVDEQRLPLIGRAARVRQLGETVQGLLQPLHLARLPLRGAALLPRGLRLAPGAALGVPRPRRLPPRLLALLLALLLYAAQRVAQAGRLLLQPPLLLRQPARLVSSPLGVGERPRGPQELRLQRRRLPRPLGAARLLLAQRQAQPGGLGLQGAVGLGSPLVPAALLRLLLQGARPLRLLLLSLPRLLAVGLRLPHGVVQRLQLRVVRRDASQLRLQALLEALDLSAAEGALLSERRVLERRLLVPPLRLHQLLSQSLEPTLQLLLYILVLFTGNDGRVQSPLNGRHLAFEFLVLPLDALPLGHFSLALLLRLQQPDPQLLQLRAVGVVSLRGRRQRDELGLDGLLDGVQFFPLCLQLLGELDRFLPCRRAPPRLFARPPLRLEHGGVQRVRDGASFSISDWTFSNSSFNFAFLSFTFLTSSPLSFPSVSDFALSASTLSNVELSSAFTCSCCRLGTYSPSKLRLSAWLCAVSRSHSSSRSSHRRCRTSRFFASSAFWALRASMSLSCFSPALCRLLMLSCSAGLSDCSCRTCPSAFP